MCNSFSTPWIIVCQAPLAIGYPKQEYWSGVQFHSAGNLPDRGIKLVPTASQADSLPLSHLGRTFVFILALKPHKTLITF